MSDFVRQNGVNNTFEGDETWAILNGTEYQIRKKIEAVGSPLKKWNINIFRGILTGYNEAFVINKKTKDDLVSKDPKSEEIIRPILRGRDVGAFHYNFGNFWLITTHNGLKERGVKPISISDYPAIKEHLDKFFPSLEKRLDKGVTPYNLRNCSYMDDFSKQKIIYPEITKFLNFYLDEEGFYTNNKCFILTGEKLNYLCAFFNSSLFKFCFRENFPELLGGSRELRKVFMDEIRIKKIDDKTDLFFQDLINQKPDASVNPKEFEIWLRNIDLEIFNIYDLSEQEIQAIGFIEIL